MLAIKFYNLRALIHRPLLSSSQLLGSCADPVIFHHTERNRILQSQKKCVLAAQQTARLLHNVEDKKQLIHGFPWWQMISCLICASSILLVASLCMGREGEGVEDVDWLAVEEDADICLTVFRELSINSNAARLAEKMMQGLKETRVHPQGKPSLRQTLAAIIYVDTTSATQPASQHGQLPSVPLENTTIIQDAAQAAVASWYPLGMNTNLFDPNFAQMPFDLSEPVVWSSQFVSAAYNPFFGQHTTDVEL